MARRGPARVPGGRLLARVREELAAGWPAGLTVLHGDDLYHLDRAQRELLAALRPDDDSAFAVTNFGDEKVDLSTVVAAARSLGMFASRRVVLVRDVAALTGEVAALTDYAKSPPPDSFLIVRAPTLDKRRKLHKTLATGGRLLHFEAAPAGDVGRWIADLAPLAAEAGVRLDADAATFLAQACGGDLYRVEGELAKLAVGAAEGRGGKIGLETVRELAAGSGLSSGWEVADAILLRDLAAGLGAVRRVVDAGDEPLRILGALAYRARTMLTAKAMLEAGVPFRQVLSATRAWPYQDQLKRGLARYSIDELLAFPVALLEADRTLKSRAIDPGAVLESLVARMVDGDVAKGV
jgi:DNA polymerase-3 subunit delta